MSQLSQPHIENSNEALDNDDDDIEIAAFLEKALCGNDDQLAKQKANHKSKFEEWLKKKYDAKKTSFVLKKHDIDRIHDVLKGVTRLTSAQERFQFKKKNYSLNADNQVCRTIVNEETHIAETKPLAYLEQFFDVLYDVHCIKRMHQGITKTFDQIVMRYHGITRSIVTAFRRACYICDLKTSQQSQPRLKPIISREIFERVQIDLVDMRCQPDVQPDGTYEWIAHMEDHNGEYHAIWAQKHKEGKKINK